MNDLEEKFKIWSDKVIDYTREHPLEVIFWEATRNCDMFCEYCCSPRETWIKKHELSAEEVIEAFREVSQTLDISRLRFVSVTGGEPFLRKDLLYILREINKLGFEKITIQTNGNAIAQKPDLIDKLIKFGIRGIGINLDGLEQTHDSIKRKKGHFDRVVSIARQIAKKRELHLTISTVVGKKSLKELEELGLLIREFNPNVWRILDCYPIGRASLVRDKYLSSPQEYKDLFSFIQKQRLMYIDRKDKTQIEFGCGGWLGTELEGRVRPFIFHCVSGINTITILYDGSITGCPNLSNDFIEGNLKKDRIADIWNNGFYRFRNFSWKKRGICKKCNQWNYCHGGPTHDLDSKEEEKVNCIYSRIGTWT